MLSFLGLIFLFFIIFYIIVPLVRAAIGLRRMRRDWKQQVNSFRRAAGFPSDAPGSSPADQPAPRRKKKIDSSTGEYIAFEEIKVDTSARYSEKGVDFQAEEQIEDVTWVDIK